MRKLYEIFKVLKVQKRIVYAETIRGNAVSQQNSVIPHHSYNSVREVKIDFDIPTTFINIF